MISVVFETATSSQEIIWDVHFKLHLECNCNLPPAGFFCVWGRLRGQSLLAVERHFVGACDRMLQMHGQHCIAYQFILKKNINKNFKRFL